jgi:hypothetical protein
VQELYRCRPIDGVLGAATQRFAGGECQPGPEAFSACIEVLVDHSCAGVSQAVPGQLGHASLDHRERIGLFQQDGDQSARMVDGCRCSRCC